MKKPKDDPEKLRVLLREAIWLLEQSQPPEGGATEAFIKKAKKALRT